MYGSLIWGQHSRIVNRLQTIQNKAIRYMTFKPKRTPVTPLFKYSGILNLKDYITQLNCLFAHDHINGLCIYLFHYDYAFMGVKYRTFLKRLPRTKYLHYDAEIWRGNGPYP